MERKAYIMRKIRTEMDKILRSPVTVIMVLAVTGVCMLSEAYMDADAHQYTVLSLLVNYNTEFFASDVNLCRLEMWRLGFGTWSYILLPLLLTGAYVYTLSVERLHGGTQFYLIREGRVSYCISKTVSAMLSGGLILLAGYLLYGLVVAFTFPGFDAYSTEKVDFYLELAGISRVIPYILFRCMWVFFYGMMSSIFGYLVSVLFTEKYILLCFPLMLSYAYSSVYNRIEGYLLEQQWEQQQMGLQSSLLEKFQILNMRNLLNGFGMKDRFATLLYWSALYLCCLILFLIRMKRNEVRGNGNG